MQPRHWVPQDPVVMAAIRSAKPDIDLEAWLSRLETKGTMSLNLLPTGDGPGIMVTAWWALVTWRRTPLGLVSYRLSVNDGMCFELRDARLPATMIQALVGHPVSRIIDVPGVGGLVVTGSGTTETSRQRIDLAEPTGV